MKFISNNNLHLLQMLDFIFLYRGPAFRQLPSYKTRASLFDIIRI